jgi:hypothetical protein
MVRFPVGGGALIVCLSTCLTWAVDVPIRASESPGGGVGSSHAAKLVEKALAAGLAGDNAGRVNLLKQAIAADPEYAPARWQSGQLKFQGAWKTPTEVAEAVAYGRRWRDYKELRTSATALADHVALAQWCMREGLTHEERYHWAVVLLSDPKHPQARRQLGLREYRGALYTDAQIAAERQQRKQAEADVRRFRPRFVELCRQARSPSKSMRGTALKKIGEVADPGAIASLEESVQRNSKEPTDLLTRDLQLALVTALSNVREHEATRRLLHYAVSSPIAEVRKLAAESLWPRPATDYVPLLMAALRAPIEAEVDLVTAPDGTVRMLETVRQPGPEADVAYVRSTNYEVEGAFGRDITKAAPTQVLAAHLGRASSRAITTKNRIDASNASAAARNQRIQDALKIATGKDHGADPEAWWEAWGAENELQYTDAEPVYENYEEDTYTYAYEQAPQPSLIQGDMRPPPPRATGSCFAPGTPVWTKAGVVPIEQVRVGDMVLAQHPTTGELDYRPVLLKTLGNPTRVLRIGLADETITATLGHRVWVNGHGWEMVKALKPAMTLNASSCGLGISSIDEGEQVACHNLIVDEFHTFFVGRSRLLVHDKTCPRPTVAVTPGFRPPAAQGTTRFGSQTAAKSLNNLRRSARLP